MKKIIALISISLSLLLICCKKDNYKNDGGVHNANVNMTTYDYLKSKPQFSSLVYLIDKTGLKETVNGDITLFAVTNYGIDDYVKVRRARLVLQTNNENLVFTIDSLPASEMKDSLKLYMIGGKINRDKMNLDGTLYDCLLGPIANTKFMIRLSRSFEYGSYVSYVDYVNYTKVIGTRDDQEPDPTVIPQEQRDISYNCQTSGIITTTGIIHVMDGNHVFLFNGK